MVTADLESALREEAKSVEPVSNKSSHGKLNSVFKFAKKKRPASVDQGSGDGANEKKEVNVSEGALSGLI